MKKTFEEVKEIVTNLSEQEYENFIKALISLETGIEDMEILNQKYQRYMKQDDMSLLSPELLQNNSMPIRDYEQQFELER